MAINVSELETRIAAIVNQSAEAPTEGSDDWNLWLKFLNIAQQEWAEAYPWKSLFKEYNALTSTSSGSATIALPSDFRKLAGYPKITADGTNTYEYPVIRPQTKEEYKATDHYAYVLGDPKAGYSLIVNPATLVSGASIYIPYISTPNSLLSPTDVSPCPNSDFLVDRAVALLWEARGDERFPQKRAEADKILARLLEMEGTTFDGEVDRRVRTVEETRYNFEWGRD